MCKILIVPKITNETRSKALAFMEKMKPLMSVGNKDGLGYAAIDSQGNLFGQRWHTNEDSYDNQKVIEGEDPGEILKDVATTVYSKKEGGLTNSFGEVNLKDITALTMHTRMATSGREFKNTHPFVYEDKDTSLIHNGVINNTTDFKFKVSSCDSEAILISYLETEVGKNTKAIQDMANKLKGYYACAAFSRDAEGARILDVFKGPDANLYGVFVKELDSLVICTSMDNIAEACKSLKFTMGKIYSLKEGFLMRFQNGVMIKKETFTPGPRYNYYWSQNDEKKTSTTGANGTVSGVSTKSVVESKQESLSRDMLDYLHTIPNLERVYQ